MKKKSVFKVVNKTPERRQWRRSGISIVNSEHISHFLLVFLLLILDLYLFVDLLL